MSLRARAERAAAALIEEHGLRELGLTYDVLVALLAVGWLEGLQEGENDAASIVKATLAHYARTGREGPS